MFTLRLIHYKVHMRNQMIKKYSDTIFTFEWKGKDILCSPLDYAYGENQNTFILEYKGIKSSELFCITPIHKFRQFADN